MKRPFAGEGNATGPTWPDGAGLISTNAARCRDCYRCVRTCPVKAVRVRGGQAEVVAELCIACGSCVRACPQRAKVVRDGMSAVKAGAEGRAHAWSPASRPRRRPISP